MRIYIPEESVPPTSLGASSKRALREMISRHMTHVINYAQFLIDGAKRLQQAYDLAFASVYTQRLDSEFIESLEIDLGDGFVDPGG